ncbi:MAG: chemotaxis-specific protein-glutamate methyltransferase CheB [Bacteroidales bacterium]
MPIANNHKIKVLIADDSALVRRLLSEILSADPSFEIIAHASNGEEAVRYAKVFKPDIISMDMIMPVMDGLEATKEIMQNLPIPIVIVSSIYKDQDKILAIKELEAGAVAVIPKPEGPSHPDFAETSIKYRNLLKIMSEVKVIKRKPKARIQEGKCTPQNKRCCNLEKISLVAIGASAGGPEAIRIILQHLQHPVKVPVVIVQHIDPHFTESYSSWLDSSCSSRVKVAQEGEILTPGTIYIAPGKRHLEITSYKSIKLGEESKEAGWNGHIPSIDVFFGSISKSLANETLSVLLSGMGKDGANGLLKLKSSGSYTLIQEKSTCLIYGMPGEAENLGAACKSLPPIEIAMEINNLIK